MTERSMHEIALMLDDLQRQVAALSRVSGTARGSIIDGAIMAYDQDDEPALSIGQQWDGSVTTAELIGPIPPTPTPPACQSGLTSIAVRWDGMFEPTEDDDMVVAPMDFARVEIHASTDPDFTAEFADTLVGTMESPRGADQLCPLPEAGTYYVRLVCRTLPGNAGAASGAAQVSTLVLPGTSDGEPPASSPTPTTTGVIDGVYLSWEPESNVDPLVYRVYADVQPGVQVDAEHFVGETTSTGLLVSVRPGDPPTLLPYDDDTYFRIVATDADGPGLLGAVVHDRPRPASGDAIQTSDGDAPEFSPTPTVISGLGVLFLRWLPPTNNDPLSYKVYASIDPDVLADAAHLIGEVTGTSFTVKALTDTSPLSYVGPTYVRVVAQDADGPAPLGDVVGGMPLQVTGPDIAVSAVTADNINAREINGDLFSGTVFLATTLTTGAIDTDPDSPTFNQVLGQRVTLNPEGLRVTDAAGVDVVKFPTNPAEDAFIRAKLITSEMQVLGNLSIEGDTNTIATGSIVTLGAGVMAPPVAASASLDWDVLSMGQKIATGTLGTFPLDFTQIEAMAPTKDGTRLWLAQKRLATGNTVAGLRLWQYDPTTAQVVLGGDFKPIFRDFMGWSEVRAIWTHADTSDPHIFGYYNGRWAATMRNPNGGAFANVLNYVPNTGSGKLMRPSWMSRRPVAYFDDVRDRLVVAEINRYQPSGNGTYYSYTDAQAVNLMSYSPIATAGGDLTYRSKAVVAVYAQDAEFGSAMCGDFDYGTTGNAKVVLSYRDSTIANIVSSIATPQASIEVNRGWPPFGAPRSMCWSPVRAQFVSVDKAGQMCRYTDWLFNGTPATYYGHTWWDSDNVNGTPSPPTNDKTHETTLGGIASVVPARRARLRFTMPAPPDKGGPDDPDYWRLYAALSTSPPPATDLTRSTYRYQTAGTSTTPGFPKSLVLDRVLTGGSSPPTTNNFPDASPGRLRSGATSTKYGRAEFEVDGFGGGQWHRLAPPGLCVPYLGVGGDVDLTLILPEVLPGWVRAIGDLASKAAYPALYAICQDRFAIGGETTGFFRLPDFRDRSPIGTGAILLGQTEGSAYGADRTARWTHTHTHGAGDLATSGPTTTVNRETRASDTDNSASATHGHAIYGSTASGGSLRHPFVGVTFIIKT